MQNKTNTQFTSPLSQFLDVYLILVYLKSYFIAFISNNSILLYSSHLNINLSSNALLDTRKGKELLSFGGSRDCVSNICCNLTFHNHETYLIRMSLFFIKCFCIIYESTFRNDFIKRF